MNKKGMRLIAASLLSMLLLLLGGCAKELITNRIPAYPVAININNPGLWATYGVAGVGNFSYFIREQRLPAGFPFLETTYTGFGGVLLFGNAPYFVDNGPSIPCEPVAYDMSCPVEAQPDVRVYVSSDNFQAVCQQCGSHYDIMGGGYPVSGPAKELNYGLKPYRCIGSWPNGYIITY